tara:strand:- start:455 stop:793 length:339 start_codon:yes stop_codon:yes gene_type:complete
MAESYHSNHGPDPAYHGGFLWGNEQQYLNGLQSAEEPQENFIDTRDKMAQELKLYITEAFSYFSDSAANADWSDVFLEMLQEYIDGIDFEFYSGEQLEYYLQGRREGLEVEE